MKIKNGIVLLFTSLVLLVGCDKDGLVNDSEQKAWANDAARRSAIENFFQDAFDNGTKTNVRNFVSRKENDPAGNVSLLVMNITSDYTLPNGKKVSGQVIINRVSSPGAPEVTIEEDTSRDSNASKDISQSFDQVSYTLKDF